jgi:hypothetical protein
MRSVAITDRGRRKLFLKCKYFGLAQDGIPRLYGSMALLMAVSKLLEVWSQSILNFGF